MRDLRALLLLHWRRLRLLVNFIGNGLCNLRNRLFPHILFRGLERQTRIDALRRGFSVAGLLFPGLCKKVPDCCYQFTFFIFT
ncbi:hypothetical protein EI28_09075 [Methanoculleus sp. MH98A]|nr:hypothetical protein EI28_09075 [Methanoculleus sp. MH98A]